MVQNILLSVVQVASLASASSAVAILLVHVFRRCENTDVDYGVSATRSLTQLVLFPGKGARTYYPTA